nr:metal ABC transporter ATP-binding protein [uncultured Caproiciproducens sp.]
MNIITIKDLCFQYENISVLSHISLSVEHGDFVGIVGSNGAGKSTLLKLMLGLLKPNSGSIRLCGQEITQFKEFSKVGYVPQNSSSLAAGFPATVEEIVKANLFSQIGFLHFPTPKHTALVQLALETVGMQEYAKRMISELSGGQQQRVMLARVLVNSPQVLLLDEPTTGVDLNAAEALYTLLQQLNREKGITVVMVTHDIERISRLAKRVLRIDHNGILEEKHDI